MKYIYIYIYTYISKYFCPVLVYKHSCLKYPLYHVKISHCIEAQSIRCITALTLSLSRRRPRLTLAHYFSVCFICWLFIASGNVMASRNDPEICSIWAKVYWPKCFQTLKPWLMLSYRFDSQRWYILW